MTFTVKANFAVPVIKKLNEKTRKAELVLAQQAMKDTSPYVPFRTGSLDQRTRVVQDESGTGILYPAPYARFLYYGKLMVDPVTGSAWARKGATKVVTDIDLKYSKAGHALAQSHWFEASKAQNMAKWERVAAKAVSKFG